MKKRKNEKDRTVLKIVKMKERSCTNSEILAAFKEKDAEDFLRVIEKIENSGKKAAPAKKLLKKILKETEKKDNSISGIMLPRAKIQKMRSRTFLQSR